MLKDKLEEAGRQRDTAVENLQPTLNKLKQEREDFDRERESLEAAILELRRENQTLREEQLVDSRSNHKNTSGKIIPNNHDGGRRFSTSAATTATSTSTTNVNG